MTYQTLEQLNSTGIIGILQANAAAVQGNMFPAILILVIWAVVSLGSFFSMIRRYGQGDLLASAVVGGFVANLIAGLLLIIPNFMALRTIVISIILEVILFMVFMMEKNLKND